MTETQAAALSETRNEGTTLLDFQDVEMTFPNGTVALSGVDLTVRPKGHVLPERAAEDLPRAFEAIRSHGVEVPMISTELVSASDPAAAYRRIAVAAGAR